MYVHYVVYIWRVYKNCKYSWLLLYFMLIGLSYHLYYFVYTSINAISTYSNLYAINTEYCLNVILDVFNVI